MDAPLPAWTHRELMLSREDQDHPGHGSAVVSVHPLLGAHVHLDEEPPRDVWQGEVGTDVHPWLADHMIHNIAALPGAAYCEMALAAAAAVLGEGAEVHDIRFEQTLLLDDQTAISAAASVQSPGVLAFSVSTQDEGQRTGRAAATLCAAGRSRSLARRRTISKRWWPSIRSAPTAPTFGPRSTRSVSSTARPSD